jgi:hypothetical protein
VKKIDNFNDATPMKAALYYPYIHFRSRRWLRTAALYYDKITRIIPAGFEPDTATGYFELGEDPTALLDDIRVLRDANFIDEEHPEPHTEPVAEQFFDVASTLLSDPEQRARIAPQLARRKEFYTIHPSKIDPTLARILEEHDLARKVGGADPHWDLEPVIGGVYMLFLAQHMAGKRSLVTDNPAYQRLMCASFGAGKTPKSGSAVLPAHADNSLKVLTAACQTVIPMDLEHAPIDKILKVRESCAEDRVRFQEKVADLAQSLEGIADGNTVSDKLARQAESVSDEVRNIKDKLLGQRIGVWSAILGLTIPVTAAVGGEYSMALASGAIAVGAGVARYLVERRIAKRSPWMYLVRASSDLPPKQLVGRITQLNLDYDPDEDDDDPRMMFAY